MALKSLTLEPDQETIVAHGDGVKKVVHYWKLSWTTADDGHEEVDYSRAYSNPLSAIEDIRGIIVSHYDASGSL